MFTGGKLSVIRWSTSIQHAISFTPTLSPWKVYSLLYVQHAISFTPTLSPWKVYSLLYVQHDISFTPTLATPWKAYSLVYWSPFNVQSVSHLLCTVESLVAGLLVSVQHAISFTPALHRGKLSRWSTSSQQSISFTPTLHRVDDT